MCIALVIALALACCPINRSLAAEEEKGVAPKPAAQTEGRQCYSAQETRERIKIEKLADPFPIIQQKLKELRAEVVSIKLCQNGPALIYEIDFLRLDGSIARIFFEARSGKKIMDP